jgi:hypothetical protein
MSVEPVRALAERFRDIFRGERDPRGPFRRPVFTVHFHRG